MHRFLIFYIKSGANIEKSRNIWYNYINMWVVKKELSIVAEKKEKRYVSDNAQLMAEWNWEKKKEKEKKKKK